MRRKNRIGLLAAAVLAPVCAEPAYAAGLVLVRDGVSLAPIVVFKDAPPLTRRAADELAAYIGKASGAGPKVVEGEPKPIPEHAIWVGYQPVLRRLFPKINFDFKHPEEILIAANDSHLVIAGRDVWDPEGLVVEGRRGKKIVGKQQEYGTANAIYTFLHEHLGVRWLWPGELGEDVLKQKTLAVAPFQYRYHPQIRARGGLLHYSSFIGGGYGTSRDWTRRQRLQLDSLEMAGGHGFSHWWEKFKDTRRDYFALQPDGTRSGYPNARTVKICQSNPAVWKQWLIDVEDQLRKDPNQRVFSASPNDGWASGHCICDNCRAWDHPKGELRTFHWAGLGQQYVALSDRHVTFANKCATLLKEKYPDKDYYVLMLAYGHSRPAPIEAIPADNVIISSVANFFGRTNLADRGSSQGTTHKEQFAAWGEIAPHLMWRPNTGSPAGWQQGQPDVSISQVIKDFKFVAENNCIGIFIDGVWEHWATHGPQYYIMAQLTWNPDIDARAVLDDYYLRGFRAGAEEVKGYWKFLEETRMRFVNGDQGYPEVYDSAFFEKANGFLDRAAKQLADAPEVYATRVEFLRAGLDYTRLIIDNRLLMAQLAEAGGQDAGIDKKVRENWAKIEKIVKDHPYSLNWGPIRPQTPRMRGLHPDYPSGKRRPRRKRAAGPPKAASTAKYVPAKEGGWSLAFEDRFNRDTLGSNWQVLDGKWAVQGGWLSGSGALATMLGFPGGRDTGYLRMELEASTDVEVPAFLKGAPKGAVRVGDLSSLLHFNPGRAKAHPHKSGYFFQFGGFWNRRNQIARNGVTLEIDSDPHLRIEPGKVHHIVVENDAGILRMFVDRKAVVVAKDKAPIMGGGYDHVGFYFYTKAKVRQVKVYVKQLPNDLDLE